MKDRIIKFRALLDCGYLPYEWIYYSPLEVPKEITDAEGIIVKNMQFTGLLDRHGKEIYEGDLLKVEDMSGTTEVEFKTFEDSEMGYLLGIGFGVYGDKPSEREVVGNIYETPELLKEKK